MTDKEKNMDNVEKNMDLETSRQTSSGLDGGCDFTDKDNALSPAEHDMDLETRRQTSSGLDGGCDFTVEENILMRRISLLADRNIERCLEDMWDDSETAAENIDKINRIGKEYARRIQLIEDKAAEQIGGKGAPPFKVIFTKTYETKEEADADEQAEYESADGADDVD